jgi:3-phenylpropionate/cinnamic acid dioxygenase small subunit
VNDPSPTDDRDGIRRLLARYCQLCDDGRFDEWGQLFTETATFSVLGTVHEGRAAAVTFITAAQGPEARGKHLISEPCIDLDGDRATVRTDYAFVARGRDGSLGITSTGRYVDQVERAADGWRFASRRIVFLGEDE